MGKGVLLFFVLCLTVKLAFSQGIVFEKGTLAECLLKARQENKLVFVDVYTLWCEPCKRVAATVFTQEKLGKYYNQHFVNCKLDGEKREGPEMVKKYKIEGYPTFLYLNGEGEVVYRFSGAKDVRGFMEAANYVEISAGYGGWEKMQEDYKGGRNDVDFLRDYYELSVGDEKERAMKRYLMALPDEKLLVPEVGKMIGNLEQYDYTFFNHLIEARVRAGEKSEDFDMQVTFPLMWKLSTLFNESIDKGDRNLLKELLTLKEKFSVLSICSAPDVIWNSGQGLFFVSPELIDLCYYYKNRYETDRFGSLMTNYMEGVMKKYPLDSIAKSRQVLVDIVRSKPETIAFFSTSLLEECDMIASHILEWTDYCWKLMRSGKTEREKCVNWIIYACRLNPYNVGIPIKAAGLLIRLKHKNTAIALLEEAIELQQAAGLGEYITVKRLQDELRAVKNGKI